MYNPVKFILNGIAADPNVASAFAKATQPPIITTFVKPQIPFRGRDWVAFRDGQEEDGLYGATIYLANPGVKGRNSAGRRV